jgi:D-alanyl-D-alanine carboxypeptidase
MTGTDRATGGISGSRALTVTKCGRRAGSLISLRQWPQERHTGAEMRAGTGRVILMAMRIGALVRGAIKPRHIAAACVVVAAFGAAPPMALAAPDSAIIVDVKTGKTLYSQSADTQRYPASLTKMMTLYLLFDALEAHKTSLNAPISVSAHCAGQAPSKLGFRPGGSISTRDAILAIVTRSANDVACAIGESLAGGSEPAFARRMTQKAHELGMSRTVFHNASGLPSPGQVTTARDMSTLGRALQDHHPEYFSYFSTPSFVWRGVTIRNHDNLVGRVPGVNGIKTGYTRASGFNLVSSVTRGGRKIVGVVMGGETGRSRDQHMASLIATYLPRASTGSQIAMVPGRTNLGAFAVASASPKDLPRPQLRPTLSKIADATPASPPEPVAKPLVLAAATAANAPDGTTNTAAVEPPGPPPPTGIASLIGANSVFALAAVDQTDAQPTAQATMQVADASAQQDDQGDASSGDTVSSIASGPGAMISGWKIQIAAAPTQSSAEDILDRALSKGAAVLAKAAPYTEPVTVDGSKLYRARFAGFANKNKARAACAYLARRDFKCLAISD